MVDTPSQHRTRYGGRGERVVLLWDYLRDGTRCAPRAGFATGARCTFHGSSGAGRNET
jgi:hypothetical protein